MLFSWYRVRVFQNDSYDLKYTVNDAPTIWMVELSRFYGLPIIYDYKFTIAEWRDFRSASTAMDRSLYSATDYTFCSWLPRLPDLTICDVLSLGLHEKQRSCAAPSEIFSWIEKSHYRRHGLDYSRQCSKWILCINHNISIFNNLCFVITLYTYQKKIIIYAREEKNIIYEFRYSGVLIKVA